MDLKGEWLTLDDLSGGLNDTLGPSRIADNELSQAKNVEYVNTPVLQRRRGYAASGTTWTHAGAGSVKICALIRHLPTGDPGAAELWGVDDSNGGGNPANPVFGRMAAGTSFSSATLKDNLTPVTSATEVYGASLRGKLFLAYNTAVDRLHVWDPDASSVRRVGLATPAAPTVANTGAGAYPATIRYYKVRWADVVSGVGTRFSEFSASTSFTPSGGGTHARITQPAVANEGEDVWQIYASADNVNFYELASLAIGTTTYDDNATPSTYSTGTLATAADTVTVPGSGRYVLADTNRLITAGSWETPTRHSRVFFSHPIGTLAGAFDEEAFPSDNFLDLEPGSGGAITGMVSLAGVPTVFKLTHIWQLIRTGIGDAPYRPENLSRVVGAINGKVIVEGEDAIGNPCVYFLSTRGPYRLGSNGLEFLGGKIKTFWSNVNLTSGIPHHAVCHADRGQVRFYVAAFAATLPNRCLVFHVEANGGRGAWTIEEYGSSLSSTRDLVCSVMFSRSPGATMSLDLKPWVNAALTLQIGDTADQTTDAAFGHFEATGWTKAFAPFGEGRNFRVTNVEFIAPNSKTISATLIKDFGADRAQRIETTPAAISSQDRALKRFDGLEIAECGHVSLLIGDDDVTSASWGALDLLRFQVSPEATRRT